MPKKFQWWSVRYTMACMSGNTTGMCYSVWVLESATFRILPSGRESGYRRTEIENLGARDESEAKLQKDAESCNS